MDSVVFENDKFVLIINNKCIVRSLINKSNGEECINTDIKLPLITITKRGLIDKESNFNHITFAASKLSKTGNFLIVEFDMISIQIIIEAEIYTDYINFKIKKILQDRKNSLGFKDIYSTLEIRILQLPISKELNADDKFKGCFKGRKTSIFMLSTSPRTVVNSECMGKLKFVYAYCCGQMDIYGCSAAIVVANTENLLSITNKIQRDFSLSIISGGG